MRNEEMMLDFPRISHTEYVTRLLVQQNTHLLTEYDSAWTRVSTTQVAACRNIIMSLVVETKP